MISIKEYTQNTLVSETATDIDAFLMSTLYRDFLAYTRKGYKVESRKVRDGFYRVSWYENGFEKHADIEEI